MTDQPNGQPPAPQVVQDIDLTTEDAGGKVGPLTPPDKLFERTSQTDRTRSRLAWALVCLLAALTMGAGIWIAIFPSNEPSIENFLKLVFTPIVGLVGSVVGFYFGARSRSDV